MTEMLCKPVFSHLEQYRRRVEEPDGRESPEAQVDDELGGMRGEKDEAEEEEGENVLDVALLSSFQTLEIAVLIQWNH